MCKNISHLIDYRVSLDNFVKNLRTESEGLEYVELEFDRWSEGTEIWLYGWKTMTEQELGRRDKEIKKQEERAKREKELANKRKEASEKREWERLRKRYEVKSF